MFTSIEEVQRLMEAQSYIADRALATTLFLAIKLEKPIFLEGEAGVGKTEVAKVLSRILQSRLIRLQCYEGLDANTALYEWNYSKQMLKIKLEEAGTYHFRRGFFAQAPPVGRHYERRQHAPRPAHRRGGS